MAIIPIRADNAYVGLSKQSVQGTGVAPTLFPRWLDGTKIDVVLKASEIWEGDGTRRLSMLLKEMQNVKGTIKFNPRPNELGFFETAGLGAGSDSFTTAVANTTLTAGVSPGATTISLAANTGLTSAGTANLILTPGGATEEVVSVTTPGTGAGPYVYTLTGGGTVKNTHASSDAVRTSSQHTITDQTDGNYYTIEFGLGDLNGAAGLTIRCIDCKIQSVKRAGKAGSLLTYDVDFEGITTVSQGSPATVTLENHQPFLFTQGVWTLNGSLTGDALGVEGFTIETKNNLDVVQAENLTPGAIIFGNLEAKVSADIIFQSGSLFALTYWGSSGGTTDSQTIGAGSLSLIFSQSNLFFTVQYGVTTLHYASASPPEPKKDGKHYKMAVGATSVSNMGANPYILQAVVQNSQNSGY